VSRQPFAAPDLQALSVATQSLRFDVLADPNHSADDAVLADLLAARNLDDLNARAIRYYLDVSPPNDARPFFFNQLRFSHLSDVLAVMQGLRSKKRLDLDPGIVAGNLIAFGTLILIILLSAVVVLFVILLPARSSVHTANRRLALIGSAYFLLIGLGFMFVEIGLIQRISVFLGHPVYALSIGLFSIILSTGLGSLLSERLRPVYLVHFIVWLGALAAYLILLLWGVNGAAGVLAAGLAVASSIGFSIDTTIRIGGTCYILLFPFALLLLRMPTSLKNGMKAEVHTTAENLSSNAILPAART
jgi:hypothetical protein